jgi:hypothetical protein
MSHSISPYEYAENDHVNAMDMGGNFKFTAEFRNDFPRVTAPKENGLNTNSLLERGEYQFYETPLD